jgi:Protein of unknown function (DUF2587)
MREENPEGKQLIVVRHPDEQPPPEGGVEEAVHHPAKVMRIAAMVRQLLDEVRHAPLDEASRSRVRDIYQTSVRELGEVLSPELKEELGRMSLPFDTDVPSEAELRVAQAQLVGWLEGLFHGIQAMLFAQQMESRRALEELRRPGLPQRGEQPPPEGGPGTYL